MLVLALKFSKSPGDDKWRPKKGRFMVASAGNASALPENGTERLSKPSKPGLGLSASRSHRSNLHSDDAVINVGVADHCLSGERRDRSVDSLERR